MDDPAFRALVVGVDAPRFVPAELRTQLHVAEPIEQRTCPCAHIHAPDDDMHLTLLVGAHDNRSPPTNRLTVMASVASHKRKTELPHVIAQSDVDFDRWALELARNLFAPLQRSVRWSVGVAMLKVHMRGKLRYAQENLEDLLTSSVFGTLKCG